MVRWPEPLPRAMPSFLGAATLCGAFAVPGLHAAMANTEWGQPVFLPGGMADPAGRTGYVMNADGGIDALDLSTGEQLWSTAVGARPLAVIGNRLAAQRPMQEKTNALEIVVLDVTHQGTLVLISDPVVFPEWVSVTPATGESFTCRVFIDNHHLLLDWYARARYQGGAAPPPQILAQATQDATGTVRINLETGEVEMLPHTPHVVAHLPDGLQHVTSRPYRAGSSWQTEPWIAGKKFCALVSKESEGRETLYLMTWDVSTGQAHEPILLVTGKALVPYVTPDGRYLFIHPEVPPSPQPPEN